MLCCRAQTVESRITAGGDRTRAAAEAHPVLGSLPRLWHLTYGESRFTRLHLTADSRPLPPTPHLHGRATRPFRECRNHAVLPTIGILGGAEALPAARRAGCQRLVGLANLYQTLHHPGVGVILYRPELASAHATSCKQALDRHFVVAMLTSSACSRSSSLPGASALFSSSLAAYSLVIAGSLRLQGLPNAVWCS